MKCHSKRSDSNGAAVKNAAGDCEIFWSSFTSVSILLMDGFDDIAMEYWFDGLEQSQAGTQRIRIAEPAFDKTSEI